jgi:hypothetical protein
MHGAPKIMIIAKREAAGELMPDFSGPGYHEARKCAVEEDSEMLDPVGDGDMDLREQLRDMAEQLDEVASRQQHHADALRKLAGSENGQYSDKPREAKRDGNHGGDSYGKAKELD